MRRLVITAVLSLASAALALAGDFNHDGFADLAVGSNWKDGSNPSGTVDVFFGAAGGLDPTESVPLRPAEFGLGGVLSGFGRALAVGDFDGDGFDDLAIGAPDATVWGHALSGCVVVVPGAASGFDKPRSTIWNQDTPGIADQAEDPIFLGSFETFADSFGTSLAAGDFDGDGFDDLAIGTGESFPEKLGAGAVHVLFGTKNGLAAKNDLFFTEDSKGVEDATEPRDHFGSAMKAGDLDKDGFADLVVQSSGEIVGSGATGGAITVFFGSASGLSGKKSRFCSAVDLDEDPTASGIPIGSAFAIADFGTGKRELAIAMTGHAENAGAVAVVPVKAGKLKLGGMTLWTQDTIDPNETVESEEICGWALASGDFDGDGKKDLAIGSPEEDAPGMFSTGIVQVLHGAAGGLHAPAEVLQEGADGVAGTLQDGDNFGFVLAAADYNGDGFVDLACGVPSRTNGAATSAGAVIIAYGSQTGLVPSVHSTLIAAPGGPTAFGLFGLALGN